MAWLPSVRRQWQSSALNLAKKASNGFNQSSFVSSTFCNSTRFNNCSIFTSSEAGLGLQGLLSRRTITTGLQSRFSQADPSTTANQKASTSETNENTANINATDDRNYRFPEEVRCLAGLGPTKAGEKARVVVLGTGWAGSRVIKGLDTKLYDVVCVSPRNHMVFTPLLASTCVGTLEFRSVAEPISRIQPELSRSPNSYFLLAHCHDINPDSHEIYCETVGENGSQTNRKRQFKVAYDKLIIASGAEALTFGIHGVKEHAIFLREVHHAQEIRRKLLSNLMLSDIPGITEDEKKRLLHCVVVGGGPTGVEFSGELSDFIKKDVHERYSHVKDYIHVTLIEVL
ncbi:internal alternative NAD(P)H-ubiquinone oxidoreductase A1, mitochondrial [Cryptomeria japonica]|uniref:internal alternative NAD(P)H-ubiquinone oxidoreductase A1, mitochondrial n=1 Tax=Cryptomeria japonica TaxID=3369 RepID=UPI0027D9E48E|nr:internal alternative NAD(P)H-ubiquinone oxidoreductase A1, mitochondrial [Cryptomeria japonica]